jgi:hypothetical protein
MWTDVSEGFRCDRQDGVTEACEVVEKLPVISTSITRKDELENTSIPLNTSRNFAQDSSTGKYQRFKNRSLQPSANN